MDMSRLVEIEDRIGREAPHLSRTEAAVLAQIVARLVQAYEPERVYLFGSKARDDAGPDSDFDLLLVVPDAAEPERRRSRLAYERMWEIGAGADVLVWPRGRFDERARLRASLPATILREGKLLYAA